MSTLRIGPGSLLVVAACLAWGVAASAQPVSTRVSSVEWTAATSPLIVRAVIDGVSVHDPTDRFHRYQTVSARVLETIKGEPTDRLQFVHNGDFSTFRLSRLEQNRQELLLFFKPWMRSGRFNRSTGGYAYTRFPYVVERVAVLTPEDVRFSETSVPPLSANLTKLSTPRELIDTIKTYLTRQGGQKPLRSETIELPSHLRGGYYRVWFTFPTDAGVRQPQSAAREPAVDFATFKTRFAKTAPDEQKPPYTRNRGGYIGVCALEWMAADCDLIVRGVIDDWCFIAATDDPTGPFCGVKMRVLETLKGKPSQELSVYVSDARDLEALQRDRQGMVMFLRGPPLSGPAAALGCQTRAGLWDDSVIVLKDRDAEVLFADLTWGRRPEEILNRLRVIADRHRREKQQGRAESSGYVDGHTGPPVFDVHPPASVAAGSSIAGNDYSIIYLPVDEDLEANARDWAAARNKDLRWLAARAMIYFKSDKNAAILRTLLGDDATWGRREVLHLIHPNHPRDDPDFLVRWEAWHVLDGWGYDAPKPDFQASRKTSR